MSKRLQILVSDELDARVKKAAARRGISAGAWVRQAIERAFGTDAGDADPVARLGSLDAPTADIDQMLAEIESGRA